MSKLPPLLAALPKRIVHGMIVNKSTPAIAPVPPHSRMFSRGSLGSDIDGRSREGKFIRKCEAELAQHIGGEPNFAQRLLIRRAARAMLRLELLDSKMGSGDWTPHDAREFGGTEQRFALVPEGAWNQAERRRQGGGGRPRDRKGHALRRCGDRPHDRRLKSAEATTMLWYFMAAWAARRGSLIEGLFGPA